MSLIFATQLTAVATATLAVFAIVTAVFAFLAYRAQAQEVGILQKQMKAQQDAFEREAQDRRGAQAARVYIGVPSEGERGESVYPYVKNASDFAIYEAELWYLGPDGQLPGGDNSKYLGTILPGDKPDGDQDFPSRGALRRTVLTFRDANNVCWIRMPGGVLEEQPAPPTPESVRAIVRTLPQELGPRAERY